MGAGRIDKRQKEAFDNVYGKKASTRVSVSFDTGCWNELKKDEETFKRKSDKGNTDSDGTVETKAEMPGGKWKVI